MYFPDSWYCGLKGKQGFIVPETSNKQSVDAWSDGRNMTFKNEAVSGFKIVDCTERCGSYYSNNTVIDIEDPRGFQLQISVGNLIALMEDYDIKQGEIMGSCLWARDKNQIYLVSTQSELYKKTLQTTVVRNSAKGKIKDLSVGDVVLIGKDETKYIYIGTYHTAGLVRAINTINTFISDKAKSYFLEYAYYNRFINDYVKYDNYGSYVNNVEALTYGRYIPYVIDRSPKIEVACIFHGEKVNIPEILHRHIMLNTYTYSDTRKNCSGYHTLTFCSETEYKNFIKNLSNLWYNIFTK